MSELRRLWMLRPLALTFALGACAHEGLHGNVVLVPRVEPPPARPAAPQPTATADASRAPPPREPHFLYMPHPDRDAAVAREYARLDAELRATFDFETGHQHYRGAAQDLFGRLDPRTGRFVTVGDWSKAATARDSFTHRLDWLIAQQPSPNYVVMALVRKASLADSMWRGITTLEERGFSTFTPAQLATLKSMQQNPNSAGLADDIRAKVESTLSEMRAADAHDVAALAIASYAWAVAFAKAYGVDDASVARARARLAAFALASTLYDFGDVLRDAPPPPALTDPSERIRSLSLSP